MDTQDLPAVTAANSCDQNTTIVMNTNPLPLFQFTSLTDDGDKTDFCSEKFGGNLISGTEGSVLQLVETSRGLLHVVSDSVNVGQLTLNGINGSSHVTLNGLTGNSDLQQTALLTAGESFSHSGAPLFEIQTETVSDQGELQLTAPIAISTSTTQNNLLTVSNSPRVLVTSNTSASFSNDKTPKRKGGWPKGKKRKKEKESHAPKAPATAYVIFAMERRATIKESNPEVSFVAVTKILGNEWSTMSIEEKQKYVELAEADKKRYMDELKEYQHSDAYQSFLKRKKMKAVASDEDSVGAEGQFGESNNILNELEEEGLFCKVCNQYFSSLHNRKEHMFGKQHLQAITSEFEKELQEETVTVADVSVLDAESSELLTDSAEAPDQPIQLNPAQYSTGSDKTLDISSFMEVFIHKNLQREREIQELKRCEQLARQQNAQLVEKLQQYKELESKLEQNLASFKSYEAALLTQIDGLRMVPMLFDVINFYIDPKDEES